MTFIPFMPDLCCVPTYAADNVQAENFDAYLAGILFFLSVLLGNRLWKVFISSFEKGSV